MKELKFLYIALLTITGCGFTVLDSTLDSSSNYSSSPMNGLIGHNIQEVINMWGQPDIIRLNATNNVYEWNTGECKKRVITNSHDKIIYWDRSGKC